MAYQSEFLGTQIDASVDRAKDGETFLERTDLGIPFGAASLDANGKVPQSEMYRLSGATIQGTSYQVSESGQEVPEGEWSETIPQVPSGWFLWVRLEWDTAQYTYYPLKQGQDGGVTSIEGKTGALTLAGIGAAPANVVPSGATASNPLVTQSEMGEAISAVEAKQIYATASQGSFATKAALTSASTFYNADGSVATPTKNDVAYVLADESHDGSLAKYTIANDPQGGAIVWGFVIAISSVSFTQEQLDALNSGITSAKVSAYDSHVSNNTIHVTSNDKSNWNGKAPAYQYSTTDLQAGTSTLATGTLYFVYE